MKFIFFPEQSYLCREGEKGDRMFLIVTGICDIIKSKIVNG